MENNRINGAQEDRNWLEYRDGKLSAKSLGSFDVFTLANAGPIDILHLKYNGAFESDLHSHGWDSLHLVICGTVVETYSGQRRIGPPGSLLYYQQDVPHQTSIQLARARIVHFPIWNDPRPNQTNQNCAAEAHLISDLLYLPVLKMLIHAVQNSTHKRHMTCAGSEIHETVSHWKENVALVSKYFLPRSDSLVDRPHDHGLSRGHFARIFRRSMECSVGQWRQKMNVTRVAQQILAGTNSLCEVAASIGFADQSHMGRVFRRELGISPGQFRKLTTQVLAGNGHE